MDRSETEAHSTADVWQKWQEVTLKTENQLQKNYPEIQ